MSPSAIQDLFNQTLIGDYDDEPALDAVSALQRNGTREIFETAASWLQDGSALKRARAADILSQLRAQALKRK